MINGKKYLLARIIAHLWHRLDLNDLKQLACHKCNNELCFNPEHIYNGNNSSNMIDAANLGTHKEVRKILCNKGHILDGIRMTTRSGPIRFCKICKNQANKRYRARQKIHKES